MRHFPHLPDWQSCSAVAMALPRQLPHCCAHAQFYANVDCLLEYPGLRQLINRPAQHNPKNGSMLDARQAKKPIDFSLHGGKVRDWL